MVRRKNHVHRAQKIKREFLSSTSVGLTPVYSPTKIKQVFISVGKMGYIKRTLEQTVIETSAAFSVVLLTGPRQVGKTTLLQKLKQRGRSYVSLDKPDTRFAAKRDPAGFINRLRLPVLIDEVQYVPELFP